MDNARRAQRRVAYQTLISRRTEDELVINKSHDREPNISSNQTELHFGRCTFAERSPRLSSLTALAFIASNVETAAVDETDRLET